MKRLLCFFLVLCFLCGTLLACTSQATYTITFDADGGSAVASMSVTAGTPVEAPAAPTKDGYTFAGWYMDEGLFDPFDFSQMPARDITLYAKWTYLDQTMHDGGTRGADGDWTQVDFGGQRVNVAISVHDNTEYSFPSAKIYTKGPDTEATSEIARAVIARNAAAETTLGISVVYVEKDLPATEILSDIRAIAQAPTKSAPDVYNNDLYGLSHAMIEGLLWNLRDAGDGVIGYLDHEADGFYTEFMEGLTFDRARLYIIAGDYFIDMIRMVWGVYVNADLLAANAAKLPSWCDSIDHLYDFILAGNWTTEMMAYIASAVFVDNGQDSQSNGYADSWDITVGAAWVSGTAWLSEAGFGVTVYYRDPLLDGQPSVREDIDLYQKAAKAYRKLTSCRGVDFESSAKETAKLFGLRKYLFALSTLGDMETSAFTSLPFERAFLPLPKWDETLQTTYHTAVDESAELGCILKTTKAYSAATALMQYLNEESVAVADAYYEGVLKAQNSDDERMHAMMDLVRGSVDSPFGYHTGKLCLTEDVTLVTLGTGNPDGVYMAWLKDYRSSLTEMIRKFEEMN